MADYSEETSESRNAQPNGDFLCGGPRLVHKPFAVLLKDATNEVVNNFKFDVNGNGFDDDTTAAPKDFNPGAGNQPAREGGNVFDYGKLDQTSGDADGD